jgi:hypothetical protein
MLYSNSAYLAYSFACPDFWGSNGKKLRQGYALRAMDSDHYAPRNQSWHQ